MCPQGRAHKCLQPHHHEGPRRKRPRPCCEHRSPLKRSLTPATTDGWGHPAERSTPSLAQSAGTHRRRLVVIRAAGMVTVSPPGHPDESGVCTKVVSEPCGAVSTTPRWCLGKEGRAFGSCLETPVLSQMLCDLCICEMTGFSTHR